jgi:hypothetical protein
MCVASVRVQHSHSGCTPDTLCTLSSSILHCAWLTKVVGHAFKAVRHALCVRKSSSAFTSKRCLRLNILGVFALDASVCVCCPKTMSFAKLAELTLGLRKPGQLFIEPADR